MRSIGFRVSPPSEGSCCALSNWCRHTFACHGPRGWEKFSTLTDKEAAGMGCIMQAPFAPSGPSPALSGRVAFGARARIAAGWLSNSRTGASCTRGVNWGVSCMDGLRQTNWRKSIGCKTVDCVVHAIAVGKLAGRTHPAKNS